MLGSCHLLPWWYFRLVVCSFFLMENLRLLHASVMLLYMIIFCSCLRGHFSSWRLLQSFTGSSVISFWRGFFPTRFSPFLEFTEIPCSWVPNMDLLPRPILHFILVVVSLRHFPKLHLRGGVRVNN